MPPPAQKVIIAQTRYDTEARVGMRNATAEMLWNRVQDNPQSLLARLIVGDLYDVSEVHGIILVYACLIIVLQAILACASHLLLGTAAFLALGTLNLLMTARHLADIPGRGGRIDRLGKTDLRRQHPDQSRSQHTRRGSPTHATGRAIEADNEQLWVKLCESAKVQAGNEDSIEDSEQ